jgi:hypothetical protein
MIYLTPGEFRDALKAASELAVSQTLMKLGLLKPYLSKAEAYKIYGRKQVDRWLREKLISKIKDGTNSSTIRLSRTELETIAATSNRMSWFTHYVPEEA